MCLLCVVSPEELSVNALTNAQTNVVTVYISALSFVFVISALVGNRVSSISVFEVLNKG